MICNRPDHEDAGQPTFAEIKTAAEAAGIEAYHIPIVPGRATGDDVVAFGTAVTTAQGKVLAYCRSGGKGAEPLCPDSELTPAACLTGRLQASSGSSRSGEGHAACPMCLKNKK